MVQAFQSNDLPLNDPQAYRQITEIGRFTRDVKHVSGVDNVFADWLSRIREENKGTAYEEDGDAEIAGVEEEVQFQLVSLDTLLDLQSEDPEIKLINSGDQPKNTSFKQETIEGRSLLCEVSSNSGPRPYVPQPLREQILRSLHNVDHKGIEVTKSRVSGEFYWPSLKSDVKNYVKKCVPCMKVKAGRKLVNIGTFRVPDRRFSHVVVDIVGPLPESYGFKYILTAI